MHALRESIAASMSTDIPNTPNAKNADRSLSVNRDNFLKALTHIRPSVSEEVTSDYIFLNYLLLNISLIF